MIDLQGTTALVTGSTQGVGASIARWLAKAGSKVILHGVVLDDHAHEALEACRKFNPDCKLVSFDLSVPISEVLDRFVQPLIDQNPDLSIVVSNAGIYIDPPFTQVSEVSYDRTMHLKGRVLHRPSVCKALDRQ